MSWFVKMIGKKSDVIAALGEWSMDNTVRDFLVAQIQRIPDPTPGCVWDVATHVYVDGCGHGGAVGNLRIEAFNPTIAPPPPAPPVSNENVAPGCEKFSGTVAVP